MVPQCCCRASQLAALELRISNSSLSCLWQRAPDSLYLLQIPTTTQWQCISSPNRCTCDRTSDRDYNSTAVERSKNELITYHLLNCLVGQLNACKNKLSSFKMKIKMSKIIIKSMRVMLLLSKLQWSLSPKWRICNIL